MAEFTEEDPLDYIGMSILGNKNSPTLVQIIRIHSYEIPKERKHYNYNKKQLHVTLNISPTYLCNFEFLTSVKTFNVHLIELKYPIY